jgi:hypothetical protein
MTSFDFNSAAEQSNDDLFPKGASVIIDPVLDEQTRNASEICLVIGDQRDFQ